MPPRVFISYARKDGAVLAQRLQRELNDKNFDAWLDTQRIAGSRVWSSYASEICRSEQLLALDRVQSAVHRKNAEVWYGG